MTAQTWPGMNGQGRGGDGFTSCRTVDQRVATNPGRGALPAGEHTELIATGIGHHDPADLALADVEPGRPEGD